MVRAGRVAVFHCQGTQAQNPWPAACMMVFSRAGRAVRTCGVPQGHQRAVRVHTLASLGPSWEDLSSGSQPQEIGCFYF